MCLISNKDALVVNQENGMIKPYPELGEKLNLKELTASLGNGVSFMSSIYLTHPQYHDAGVYGGDSGGSGEIKMSDGYVLSDEILKHKINGSAFDHVYPYNASSSLNDLDVFTKGHPFDLYKELRKELLFIFIIQCQPILNRVIGF